jgi:uncharacterized protein YjbI with pentapeptide repeats
MDGQSALSFRAALFRARNAEEAALSILNACARATGEVSNIEHPDPTTFGAWLRRVQGQRTGPASALVMDCLSFLRLTGISLDICDLYGANFEGSDLSSVAAHGACARSANFANANLTKTIFSWADLTAARLDQATLSGTDFTDSNLTGCSLDGVKIEDIELLGADLEDVVPPDTKNLLSQLQQTQRAEFEKQHPSLTHRGGLKRRRILSPILKSVSKDGSAG